MFAIGTSLKEARLRKGLDLAAAAEATKIRSRHLQALEDEQFDMLPGQTYVRGFLKTYADFLGLDGQLYVDEYSSRFWVSEDGGGPRTPRKVRVRRKHHGRIELNMIVLTLVAITGVTALVIAAWKFGGTTPPARTGRPASAPTKPTTVKRGSLATLVVTTSGGSSLVDVHVLGSAGRVGRLLFHGTLERGESQTFVQRDLWLSVSSPAHVALALNGGSPLRLSGTCPVTIAVTPQQITQQPTSVLSCH
jgi:cytoskeletal protein RodZ